MINIEPEIFTMLDQAIRVKFPDINVVGEAVQNPGSFPHLSIVEADNIMYERTQDSESAENHATLTYEVNICSNKQTGRKAECKEIFAVLDDTLTEIGFTRIMCQPVQNEDPSIYRMSGRYQAVVSKDNIIYRR